MSNPFLVQVPFCYAGSKNAIQIERQPTQDPEDATYNEGFPPLTMAPTESGGLPPKGLDFNGVFYELSSPIAHYCRGDRIQFDATYAAAIGGYSLGAILASNDYQRDYISLVDNNTADPNSTNTTWAVYSGQGAVPVATSTTNGTVKIVNSLASTATDAALTAAQGKALQDGKLNTSQALGVGQTWQNLTSSRINGGIYYNNTGKPIQVYVSIRDTYGNGFSVIVGGVTIVSSTQDLPSGYYYPFNFIVPAGQSYVVSWAGGTNSELISWSELR